MTDQHLTVVGVNWLKEAITLRDTDTGEIVSLNYWVDGGSYYVCYRGNVINLDGLEVEL